MIARRPSRDSLRVTNSPFVSGVRAITTLSDSLSTTSPPADQLLLVERRVTATRILRPPEYTSTVPSSLRFSKRAVRGRRLGELVDLLAQGGDVCRAPPAACR
jgi:hypothetical protein